jgi:hypothetical protein
VKLNALEVQADCVNEIVEFKFRVQRNDVHAIGLANWSDVDPIGPESSRNEVLLFLGLTVVWGRDDKRSKHSRFLVRHALPNRPMFSKTTLSMTFWAAVKAVRATTKKTNRNFIFTNNTPSKLSKKNCAVLSKFNSFKQKIVSNSEEDYGFMILLLFVKQMLWWFGTTFMMCFASFLSSICRNF